MTAVQNILNGYDYIFYELASTITREWFLVAKPFQIASLIGVYLYFCISLGPQLMKHRKPFDLKNVMIFYNIFQIIFSIYLVQQGSQYFFIYNFNFTCQGLESDDTLAEMVAVGMWYYYMAKIIELLDTVFFVLRKSNRQITSLHLHHHTLMPLSVWLYLTYYPGGQGILIGTLNSLVHVFMYAYYLLAGFGDKYKNYLYLKKYVTMMQLAQFLILFVHHTNSVFYECSYPMYFKIFSIIYFLFFIYSFGIFYYYSYIKKPIENYIAKNGSKKR